MTSLGSISIPERLPSNNINNSGGSRRIRRLRKLESDEILSWSEIVLLSVSCFFGVICIVATLIWWRRRRNISRLVHDVTSHTKEKVDVKVSGRIDSEDVPAINSILVNGTLSFPEISISKQKVRVKSEDDDESEDDTPSINNSEVSSMWDSTSQQWDNNYFIELEKMGRHDYVRKLSVIASEADDGSGENSNSQGFTNINLNLPSIDSETRHRPNEISTRGSI